MNTTITNLLKEDSRALKAINETFHIDWNKPFQAIKIEGKTTINQILKKVDNSKDSLILVLNYIGSGYNANKYCAALIDWAGCVIIEEGYHKFHLYTQKLDTYWRKSDFRDHLKYTDVSPFHVVIVQDKQYLTNPKKPTIDYSERYMKDPSETWGNRLIRLSDGINFDQYYHDTKKDLLDKSGYIVEYFRDELQRRAKALKAEREKAAVNAMDFSTQVEELKIRITAKKLELIEQLKNANTSDDLRKVSEALKTYGNGFASIMDSFERMQRRVNNKEYPSINDFNRHYEGISNMLIENGKR